MFDDEFGNSWASYEDYMSYCKNNSEQGYGDISSEILKSIIDNKKEGTIYIDKDGRFWESEKKYKESKGERGC
jgi:hypothetical protein